MFVRRGRRDPREAQPSSHHNAARPTTAPATNLDQVSAAGSRGHRYQAPLMDGYERQVNRSRPPTCPAGVVRGKGAPPSCEFAPHHAATTALAIDLRQRRSPLICDALYIEPAPVISDPFLLPNISSTRFYSFIGVEQLRRPRRSRSHERSAAAESSPGSTGQRGTGPVFRPALVTAVALEVYYGQQADVKQAALDRRRHRH